MNAFVLGLIIFAIIVMVAVAICLLHIGFTILKGIKDILNLQ